MHDFSGKISFQFSHISNNIYTLYQNDISIILEIKVSVEAFLFQLIPSYAIGISLFLSLKAWVTVSLLLTKINWLSIQSFQFNSAQPHWCFYHYQNQQYTWHTLSSTTSIAFLFAIIVVSSCLEKPYIHAINPKE